MLAGGGGGGGGAGGGGGGGGGGGMPGASDIPAEDSEKHSHHPMCNSPLDQLLGLLRSEAATV